MTLIILIFVAIGAIFIFLLIFGFRKVNLGDGKGRLEIIQRSFTIAALLIAGIWAFYQFQITQIQFEMAQVQIENERKGEPAIEATVQAQHILQLDGRVFLRVILELKNIGTGLYKPPYGWGAYANIHNIQPPVYKPSDGDSKKQCPPPNRSFNFKAYRGFEEESCFRTLGVGAGGYDSKKKGIRFLEPGESTTVTLHFMLPKGTKAISIYAKPFECKEYECVKYETRRKRRDEADEGKCENETEKIECEYETKKRKPWQQFEGVWSIYKINETKAINF